MRLIKSALILVLLGFLSSLASAAFYGPYGVTSATAIDGDTLRADVHIWPDQVADVAIRVRGVDTPELKSQNPCERELAVRAKAFTESWISANGPIVVGAVTPDKYAGRYDAVVTGLGGKSLADALIAAGHGRPYSGGARTPWCQ